MSIYAHITGRIGRDAETRSTQTGKTVTGFVIATDHGFGDRKKAIWIDCALWGERGERVASYLTKGKAISVHGELSEEEYQKRDGTQGHKLKLDVKGFDFCGKGDQPVQQPAQQPARQAPMPAADDLDSDIPF